MAALPAKIAGSSSTPRKLLSIIRFVRAIHHLWRGLRSLLFYAYLVWVFIPGGVVPSAAVGNTPWGEFVTGISPNQAPHALACQLLPQLKLDVSYELYAGWLPREQNLRADYPSRVSEMRHHSYRILTDSIPRAQCSVGAILD